VIPYRISEADVRKLHALHAKGAHISELGDAVWRRYGFASPESARNGLRLRFRKLGLPVRTLSDATLVAAGRLGGNWTPAMIGRLAALREAGLSSCAIAAVLTLDFPDVQVTRHSVRYRIEVLEGRLELQRPERIIGYARREMAA